jgi:tetratricopeptide (TPR) repeat protein
MRAREMLFDLLVVAERIDEAIVEGEAMLELNPNDNQGMRDYLLGLYLLKDRTKDARRLMKRYREPHFAVHAWGAVLEKFLSNNRAEARRALARAFRQNPNVLAYLLGAIELPKHSPAYYSAGDVNEAYHCVEAIGHAWSLHPRALKWLVECAPSLLTETTKG